MASKTQQGNAQDMTQLFEAFTAFMASQQTPATPAPAKRTPAKRSSGKATPKGRKASEINAETAAKRTPKASRTTPAGVITCGEAWKLLGADPTYAPSNPSAPARNAQLWALNAKGLLRVAQ